MFLQRRKRNGKAFVVYIPTLDDLHLDYESRNSSKIVERNMRLIQEHLWNLEQIYATGIVCSWTQCDRSWSQPEWWKQLHQLLRVDMLVASTPRISVVKFTVAWSEHIQNAFNVPITFIMYIYIYIYMYIYKNTHVCMDVYMDVYIYIYICLSWDFFAFRLTIPAGTSGLGLDPLHMCPSSESGGGWLVNPNLKIWKITYSSSTLW